VLGTVHAGGERLEGVVGEDGDGRRAEDGAGVDALVRHEVHHHARRRALAGEGLVPGALDGVGARQLAGQGGVEVDDASREPAEEAHREDAHPAGEHDDVGAEPGDDVGEAGVVVRSGLALVAPDVHRRDAGDAGAHQGVGVGVVGDDGGDAGRQPPVGTRVDDRLQVAAVARGQHHETRALHGSTLDGHPDGPTDA
jgi:hypothetical protein